MNWCHVFIVFFIQRARARVKFKQDPLFHGYELFTSSQLGSTSGAQTVDTCASICANNTKCAIFAFDHTQGNCQLFDDVLYPDLYFETYGLHPEKKYYFFTTDWCEIDLRYVMLRETNICMKTHKNEKTFQEARDVCLFRQGSLAVLEDISLASLVIDLLARMGLSSTPFYVGADDLVSGGQFVWHDGRQMTRGWWSSGAPASGQNCVVLLEGTLHGAVCTEQHRYICIKTQ